jgi:hypothetical protein
MGVRAEVGMQVVAAVGQDPVDHFLGVARLLKARDVLVERVARRQQLAAAQPGVTRPIGGQAAVGRKRGCCEGGDRR